MAELKQTRGTFKARGLVNRIDGDNAFREGEIARGKFEGNEYKSLRFGVKTSETNEVFVEMFGMERDVYAFKPLTKKEREKGKKAKVEKLSFDERDDVPEGYKLIGVTLGIETDKKGKQIRETLVEFDASEKLFDTLDNGDSVYVSGDLEFSEYEGQNGLTKQTKYIIKNISTPKKEVDFEDKKFKELSYFEQEIVFVDSEMDKSEGKLYITARTIDFKGDYIDSEFVIDANKKESQDITKAFSKKLKFGDFVKVEGVIHNRLVVDNEEEEENEEDDIFGDGGKKPNGSSFGSKRLIELEITSVDTSSFEKGKYDEDDFEVEDDEEEDDDDNPFNEEEDDDDDDEEDED